MNKYCNHCKKERYFLDILPYANRDVSLWSAFMIPFFLMFVRSSLLRPRCVICLSAKRLRPDETISEVTAQNPREIEKLLSRFSVFRDRGSSGSNDSDAYLQIKESESQTIWIDTLAMKGYDISVLAENPVYVGKIDTKEWFVYYFICALYILFLPISLWNWIRKRRNDPGAGFFPANMTCAGRIIASDRSLLIYSHEFPGKFKVHLIAINDIREVRQHRSELRIQFTTRERQTLSIFAGQEIGNVLAGLAANTRIHVRDADWRWKRPNPHAFS